ASGVDSHVTLRGRILALKQQETSHYSGRKTLLNRPVNSRSHTTDKSIPVLPVPLAAVLPDLGPAAEPGPPLETARRLALSHLELSISRT
ncbi:hypothetical protein, partial [Microbacterium sp. KRD172]|uniref:hypothetical protein n=1 Tax=Microbacterium sp. KRD172 TaxID=2729727 RepID=UPI0019D124CA